MADWMVPGVTKSPMENRVFGGWSTLGISTGDRAPTHTMAVVVNGVGWPVRVFVKVQLFWSFVLG